ncbi:hypothetical protein GCM10010277_68810 [Streptomyces longisporoflavus]|nr:hypothetical protein GCM10010277_68810 [Streptomyces longisporoflavus]
MRAWIGALRRELLMVPPWLRPVLSVTYTTPWWEVVQRNHGAIGITRTHPSTPLGKRAPTPREVDVPHPCQTLRGTTGNTGYQPDERSGADIGSAPGQPGNRP